MKNSTDKCKFSIFTISVDTCCLSKEHNRCVRVPHTLMENIYNIADVTATASKGPVITHSDG